MSNENKHPDSFYDDEFQRITEQAAYDDAAAVIEEGQAHHDAQVAEQQANDDAFQQIVDPNGLNALNKVTTDSAQSLRGHGELAALDVLNPDPHDDETLTRLAKREETIKKWTEEAVKEFGDDPAVAAARYRKMYEDADQELARRVRTRYELEAQVMEGLGTKPVTEFTPRENRMRGIIRRSRGFVGKIFGLGS